MKEHQILDHFSEQKAVEKYRIIPLLMELVPLLVIMVGFLAGEIPVIGMGFLLYGAIYILFS